MPVEARFSTPIQTNPAVHPASYPISARLFSGVRHQGHGINDPNPSSNKANERVELYLYSPSGSLWPVLGKTLLNFYFNQNGMCCHILAKPSIICFHEFFSVVLKLLHTDNHRLIFAVLTANAPKLYTEYIRAQ
jgi:hypothetical protein